MKVTKGEKLSKPEDPTRAGYTFAGWYKDAAKTQVFNFTTETITVNITLYAKWNLAYTVSSNTDGGSAVAPVEVSTGGMRSKPEAPTRAGYILAGCYKDAAKTASLRLYYRDHYGKYYALRQMECCSLHYHLQY